MTRIKQLLKVLTPKLPIYPLTLPLFFFFLQHFREGNAGTMFILMINVSQDRLCQPQKTDMIYIRSSE